MGGDPRFRDFDDLLSVYLGHIHQIPPLSRDEEIACIRHVRAGDQQAAPAMKRLAEANLLVVVSIEERYRNSPVSMRKLIEEGNVALIHAIRALHESGEVDFSAHVTGYVERALAKFVGPADSGLNQTGH